MKTQSIQELRANGWKVLVCHSGVRTFIMVTDPVSGNSSAGDAECSEQDSYNRKLGNQIALGRSLKEMTNNKFVSPERVEYIISMAKNAVEYKKYKGDA